MGASTAARCSKAAATVLVAMVVTFTSRAFASEVSAQVRSPSARSSAVDQWSDLLAEAALRTGLPAVWLHDLMRAESNGNALAVSRKGAIGLMQLMPATYAMLRIPLGLGTDPFAPRDNILAGAAYLRLLVDRYGWPGALAAYNAGPARLEAFLARGRALPAETIAYLWRLAPTGTVGLVGSIPTSFPMPFAVTLDGPPKAPAATSHETMFVAMTSTPSVPRASVAETVTSRRHTTASWRESSLFAPVSPFQALP